MHGSSSYLRTAWQVATHYLRKKCQFMSSQFEASACPKCSSPFTEILYATKNLDANGGHVSTTYRHRCPRAGCNHTYDRIRTIRAAWK